MSLAVGYILLLSVFWFLIYWLVGGVIFAVLALLRLRRLRKARFSCLFTLSAMLTAYGSARAGVAWGSAPIGECLERAQDTADALAAVFGCGVLEISITGLLGFITLFALGVLCFYLSLGQSKSWTDDR